MSHVFHIPYPIPAGSTHKSIPYTQNRQQHVVEIRPKGGLAITAASSSAKIRKRQHADAQKCQRDRMKVALDHMARIMKMGGVGKEGTNGTKDFAQAQLLETAVEYMQHLQGQVEELRESNSGHATSSDVDSVTGVMEKRL